MKLHVLDCGSLTVPRWMVFGGEGDVPLTVPTAGFLIRHSDGDVVFEGGFPLEVVTEDDYWVGLPTDLFRPHTSETQHVRAQVEALGVDPRHVRYVVVSHLHFDHTGALGHFPNAEYVVHERELDYAREPDWFQAAGYQRRDFERPGIEWKTIATSEDSPMFDLFGDGTIQTVFAPGHTPGLMGLAVQLPDTGPVILTSDAADTQAHYAHHAMPSYVDGSAVVRSVDRLRRLEQEWGASMVIHTHDPEQWTDLRTGSSAYT